MALIVISGLPCSGKSSTSAALKSALEPACASIDLQIMTVDESLLSLSRDACYRGEAKLGNCTEL